MISWFEKRRLFSLLMIILITTEIFYFSSFQGSLGTAGSVWPSRIYHFTVFFLFAFFLLALIKGKQRLRLKHFLTTLIISIIHAFLDEFHQTFVPFRDASTRDVLTNSIGIFFAVIIYLYINKKQNQ